MMYRDWTNLRQDGGGMRLDYVLPSISLDTISTGVFWPSKREELFALTKESPKGASSDHRLVWADVRPRK